MKDITPPNNKRSIQNIFPQKKDNDDDFNSRNDSFFNKNDKNSKIRDFKIKSNRAEDSKEDYKKESRESSGNYNYQTNLTKKRKKKKVLLWLFGSLSLIAVIFIIGFGVSSQFATAEVSVTPMSFEKNLNEDITAYKEPSSENLSFETITVGLNQPRTVSVKASGEEYLEEKASGLITIYNEFTTSQQVLVKNTRFESPEGYIFRINRNVTIPGMSNGKPGTTQIEVYADEPGSEYNIEPSTFTIPGFEGTAQFDGFYAKSSSSMTGGKKGDYPIINEDDLAKAEEELHKGIEEELSNNANELIPEGFLFFNEAYSIEENKETKTENENTTLNLNAYLHGVLIKEDALVTYLYKEMFGKTEPVEVQNWKDLTFELQNKENIKDTNEITFSVSGKIKFYRTVNTKALADELAGISIKNTEKIESIFNEESYPIHKAEVVRISPFWMPTFPGNSEKIKINIVY
jgi:hypothetical protein